MRKILIFLLIYFLLISVVSATIVNVTNSSNEIKYSDNNSYIPSTVFSTMFIIPITDNIVGVQNISIILVRSSGFNDVSIEVLKNTESLVYWTEDGHVGTFYYTINVTKDWIIGDNIVVKGYRGWAGAPYPYVRNFTFSYTNQNYPQQLLTPVNLSNVYSPVTLSWKEAPQNFSYYYQISTDSAFINIVTSGTISSSAIENISTTVSLNQGTYYWHVANSSGVYNTTFFQFTVPSTSTLPGQLNVTTLKEYDNNIRVMNFTTYLYKGFGSNSIVATQTTSTGWTNFSFATYGITQEEYVVQVVPYGTNISYMQRTQLATPNSTVYMYSPDAATDNVSINQLQLNDITGLFPIATTQIYIYYNGSVMYSNNFGADGNVNVYLVIGRQYTIVLRNRNNIWNYGYYTPIASGAQQLLVSNFILNASRQQPFIYNISYSQSDITLNWLLQNGTLSHLYFNIYKNDMLTNVHTFNTTVPYGQSMYAVTDLNAIYYVTFEACFVGQTVCRTTSFPIDYRIGLRRNSTDVNPFDGTPAGIGFSFGGLLPQSWLNMFTALIIIVLIGCFGGSFSGLGIIIALVMLLIFESVGMFIPAAVTDPHNYFTMGITGGLLVLAIASFMKSRGK